MNKYQKICFCIVLLATITLQKKGDDDKDSKNVQSDKKVTEAKKDFDWMDTDKSFYIDAGEVRAAIPAMEEDDITEYFEQFDSDKDGVLSFEEFLVSANDFNSWRDDSNEEGDNKNDDYGDYDYTNDEE